MVFTSKEGTALGCYLVPAARPSEISTQLGREPLLCPRRARATPERVAESQSSQRGGGATALGGGATVFPERGRGHSLGGRSHRLPGSVSRGFVLERKLRCSLCEEPLQGLGGWESHPPPNPQEWVGAGAWGIKTNKRINKPLYPGSQVCNITWDNR